MYIFRLGKNPSITVLVTETILTFFRVFKSMEEDGRYSRQSLIPGWKQSKLDRCSVVLVGVGAIGSYVGTILASSGVKNITIIDFDSIELSTVVVSGNEEPGIIIRQEDGKQKIIIQKTIEEGEEEKKAELTGGRVIKVNKKLNIVIINFGKEHGVREYMEFGVSRGTEMVASIRVMEIRDQISACEIIYLKDDADMKEGDIVSRLDK